MKLRFVLSVCSLLLLACGGGGGGGGGSVERPLEPNEETVEKTFNLENPTGGTNELTFKIVGYKDIGGVSWPRYTARRSDGASMDGPEIWMTWSDVEVTFIGGEIWWGGSGVAPPEAPLVSGTLTEAVTLPLNVPVGEPQTLHVTGEAVIGDPANPINTLTIDTDFTYTLQAENLTVETSMGPIPGCKHLTGSTEIEGTAYECELWIHPTIGFVNAWVNWPPPNGVSLDIQDLKDWGDGSDWNEIQGMALVSPGGQSFRVDTYDANQTFDADKNTHAKMLLELRWADPVQAAGTVPPDNYVEFGTAWGYFGHELVQSPVSIFHPEENGQGFTYWYALVDQAAKNEAENGIAYHVAVNPGSAPVRATARIVYKKYTP